MRERERCMTEERKVCESLFQDFKTNTNLGYCGDERKHSKLYVKVEM